MWARCTCRSPPTGSGSPAGAGGCSPTRSSAIGVRSRTTSRAPGWRRRWPRCAGGTSPSTATSSCGRRAATPLTTHGWLCSGTGHCTHRRPGSRPTGCRPGRRSNACGTPGVTAPASTSGSPTTSVRPPPHPTAAADPASSVLTHPADNWAQAVLHGARANAPPHRMRFAALNYSPYVAGHRSDPQRMCFIALKHGRCDTRHRTARASRRESACASSRTGLLVLSRDKPRRVAVAVAGDRRPWCAAALARDQCLGMQKRGHS
ncbi:protein of unknown function [Modestobacter italicus]|uniref:Uncharacterized protein n=1 Tax=Modestobacter italicus (strain DSM 44449 / CECT 9708 / BC 501) TaxID=2732864 RepID=I4F280_MODI5|nr:protein of unknown function [Modestobacter marinus]